MINTQKPEKHLPMRRCLGCMKSFQKDALVRILRTPKGQITLDVSGKSNGRGAYLCRHADCLVKARKARRFERAFKGKIDDEIYEGLEKSIVASEVDK